MNRWGTTAMLLAIAALTYVGLTACAQPSTPPAKAEKSADTGADEAAIRATGAAFVKAFNAGDAKGIAEQFLSDGEMVDEQGNVRSGQKEIEQDLADYFADNKGAKIEIDIATVRVIGGDLAFEEGTTTTTPPDNGPVVIAKYTAVHAKRNGTWKVVTTRTLERENASPHEHLKQLEWLVGDWVDESPDVVVKHHCQWSEDGNFFLIEFEAEIAGRKVKGTQRIGWDPVFKQLKSWVFDSSGGFGEGRWTYIDGSWIVKANAVQPDGTVTTATNAYTPLDKDRFNWSSTGRVVGGQVEPDLLVLIVRKPPAPVSK